MYSGINKKFTRTAAWRISAWGTLAFAVGALIVFLFLNKFVSNEIQNRSDSWLSGEVEVLGEVAEHTPKGALYDRIVDEVAELATNEVPNDHKAGSDPNEAVFFLEAAPDRSLKLWVGKGNSTPFHAAIVASSIIPGKLVDLDVAGYKIPYRVACIQIDDGSHVYLGLSERNDRRVLRRMRLFLTAICLSIVLLGFLLVFNSSRRMLMRVQKITETAAHIGQENLNSRVIVGANRDEIAHLASTLNHMLDRIESAVRQLHTITDSLAHDLRSPMMAIRGKLELALLAENEDARLEPMAAALEEIDKLSNFLTQSLDVAEANAEALRLRRETIDLNELVQSMVNLYEPSLVEHGIHLQMNSTSPIIINADQALMHRMFANLLDNAIKHLPRNSTVHIDLHIENELCILRMYDDGLGFPVQIIDRIFEKSVKGESSTGSGLGLAFVEAVVRAHGGHITANNLNHGACLTIELPIQSRNA